MRNAASVYVFFRDSPMRRAALATEPGSPERYVLFGFDELARLGMRASHNLQAAGPTARWARGANVGINRLLHTVGGYGGDFAAVLPHLAAANSASVVFSTVDTVGIPLLLLRRAGLLRRPLVYTSIGLPERLDQLRGQRVVRLYRSALGRAGAVVAYSAHECDVLREAIGSGVDAAPVTFVRFGVDVSFFRPMAVAPEFDVMSIGVDPRRDFDLLVRIAERHPDLRVRIVASAEHARALGRLPRNVQLDREIPLCAARDRLAAARVVALPVRDNSYSGATTALLQAMAMGKPVVVSRTKAIERGYELVDGDNCRLVAPGDELGFERAVCALLDDPDRAAAIGERARTTAERHLSWERYTSAIATVLADAVARDPAM